jgi:hypothetical protein
MRKAGKSMLTIETCSSSPTGLLTGLVNHCVPWPLTPQLMANITYTDLELDPAAIYSVRPPSLRVIYVADKYLIFIDYSAVWFEA